APDRGGRAHRARGARERRADGRAEALLPRSTGQHRQVLRRELTREGNMTAKREVYVLGGYMTDFARNWTKENKHFSALMREAVIGALERTGIAPEEIESAHVGNFAAELYCMQGHLGAV